MPAFCAQEMFDLVDENGDGFLQFPHYKKIVEITRRARFFAEQWQKTCEAQGVGARSFRR